MSRDHREKREPIATMLARQRADLDRVWNEAKRRRSGAAVLRDPDQLRRIREAREAEATFTLDLTNDARSGVPMEYSMKNIAHPLEHNADARAYYESLTKRASRGGVCIWREVVEQCHGSLPTWAARKQRAREKAAMKQAAESAN